MERDIERGTCKLEPSTTILITRQQPMAVDDDEPIHRVVNCQHGDQRALSLHIYSRPFDTCEIYSLEDHTYKDIQLSYWSEYGTLCQG